MLSPLGQWNILRFYTNFQGPQDVIPYHLFGQLQNIVDWAAGMRNFNNYLQVPALLEANNQYCNELKQGSHSRKVKRYMKDEEEKKEQKQLQVTWIIFLV